jgi:hypothetical protein
MPNTAVENWARAAPHLQNNDSKRIILTLSYTRPRIFLKKANANTRYRKTVVRKSSYLVSLRQFRDREASIQLAHERLQPSDE